MRSLLFVTFLIAIRAMGQEPAAAPVADFSEGFKRLAALGMPPLDAKAKWSTLPSRGFRYDRYISDGYVEQALSSLQGNGWLIPGVDGKNQALHAATVEVTPLNSENSDPSSKRSLTDQALGGGSSPKKAAAIPEADAAKDIATLVKYLDQKKSEDFSFSWIPQGMIAGKLLLLATKFHQTGQTQLANELALATRYPNPHTRRRRKNPEIRRIIRRHDAHAGK